MNNVISINNRKIGPSYCPYIIAEMSANHNGSINKAFKIIDMAKESGADAVKLQTYRPDTITMNMRTPEFTISGGLWDGKSLYELYEEAFTPWEWHKPLFDHAKKRNITIFSSPFDRTAVDLLEDLNTPAYKIASFEAIDLPLIRYVAGTGKPMIISTGMADAEEIEEAVDTAKEGGCKEIALLHCVSGYPAPVGDYNLRTITDMTEKYGLVIGLSDHTLENTTALGAVALGGSIIEKHVTLDKNGGGPDDTFSLEQRELKELVDDVKTIWEALGTVDYGRKSSEKGNAQFRRSLYFSANLKKGDVLFEEHIKSIRPGYGLPPKYFDEIIGKKVSNDVEAGTPTSWDVIEK